MVQVRASIIFGLLTFLAFVLLHANSTAMQNTSVEPAHLGVQPPAATTTQIVRITCDIHLRHSADVASPPCLPAYWHAVGRR
jgi:hypothetical protein